MGLGLALVAVGALLAFTITGDVLGVDTDVLGVLLMAAGVVLTLLALSRTRRGHRPHRTDRP